MSGGATESSTARRTACGNWRMYSRIARVPYETPTRSICVAPIITYAAPGEFAGRPDVLYDASRYAYHEGANKLPLVVLVDGGTASAAEDFAETLQDQHAAIIAGSPTMGAGCGFTNGGIPTVLPRSGARVKLPDCARFRADGSNAVAGVAPDLVLPLLDRDSPWQRAAKITAGLDAAWRRLSTR